MKIRKERSSVRKLAPYTRRFQSQLPFIDVGTQKAFDRWFESTLKPGKYSTLTELPSSRVPDAMSHIDPNRPQIFAVLDTCSIVSNTIEFIDYVTNLRNTFRNDSPIKFIISLTVLEELDKCNRPNKKRKDNKEQVQQNQQKILDETNSITCKNPNTPVDDLFMRKEPPRAFMKFISDEIRMNQILIPQMDPFKKIQIPSFEIINKDDRILECCLRCTEFIKAQPHHEDTRLILITEDNIFKTKATTYGIASFRWREFSVKYLNFGKRNCVATPVLPPGLSRRQVIPNQQQLLDWQRLSLRSPKKSPVKLSQKKIVNSKPLQESKNPPNTSPRKSPRKITDNSPKKSPKNSPKKNPKNSPKEGQRSSPRKSPLRTNDKIVKTSPRRSPRKSPRKFISPQKLPKLNRALWEDELISRIRERSPNKARLNARSGPTRNWDNKFMETKLTKPMDIGSQQSVGNDDITFLKEVIIVDIE